MDSSALVRIFGFPATLVHGDTLVLDRWNWLKKRLPVTRNGETLLDVGCGTGAFTIGAARRGYKATGLSWDERNQDVAARRAEICGTQGATFIIGDVRKLEDVENLDDSYDTVICLECVEHILNDRKLFADIAGKLKPGGRLLLTTPHFYYIPITPEDQGPFQTEELGWHVRRGYTPDMLRELCEDSGLKCSEITYCGGLMSQRVTTLLRLVGRAPLGQTLKWVLTCPFRLAPVILPDRWLTQLLGWPFFSICLEAYKPRFAPANSEDYLSPVGAAAQ